MTSSSIACRPTFLDLCIGRELDLLVNEHGQRAGSRLVWWIRIDEQWVKIKLRVATEAEPSPERCLTIDITEASSAS